MQIEYSASRSQALAATIAAHDFSVYQNFTHTFRGFEVPNLDNEIKMSVLNRLSAENWRDIPSFNSFWQWFRTKHGMATARQLCAFMFPKDERACQYLVNCMRSNKGHDWWNHIKARVYKIWCSIVTELQAVYAVAQGVEQKNLLWQVHASSTLDAAGLDFLLVLDDKAVGIQVKKDSFQAAVQSKKNSSDNLTSFALTKRSQRAIEQEISRYAKSQVRATCGLVLKYGLSMGGRGPAYPYLREHSNGFVYFDSAKLVQCLEEAVENIA